MRKAKGAGVSPSVQSDLNLPVTETVDLVPVGLVSSRVTQLAGGQPGHVGDAEELLKKQKMSNNQNDARSTTAASGSPRRAQ